MFRIAGSLLLIVQILSLGTVVHAATLHDLAVGAGKAVISVVPSSSRVGSDEASRKGVQPTDGGGAVNVLPPAPRVEANAPASSAGEGQFAPQAGNETGPTGMTEQEKAKASPDDVTPVITPAGGPAS